MADNGHSDRLDRIEEQIEANWKVIKANSDLLTRMDERQERTDERQERTDERHQRMDERQDRTQEQLDQLSRDIGFLFASVQGHMAQPHPPAHAREDPPHPRSAGE